MDQPVANPAGICPSRRWSAQYCPPTPRSGRVRTSAFWPVPGRWPCPTARLRNRARQPCGLPWTPETSAAPGVRNSGQAQGLPLARRAARRPAVAGGCGTRTPGNKVNWRSINRRRGKITQIQARAQGPVTSSQQSHLAKLRHTEPGVHETRDAPVPMRALGWGFGRLSFVGGRRPLSRPGCSGGQACWQFGRSARLTVSASCEEAWSSCSTRDASSRCGGMPRSCPQMFASPTSDCHGASRAG